MKVSVSIDTCWRIVCLIPAFYLFFGPVKGVRAVMISFLFWTISITF